MNGTAKFQEILRRQGILVAPGVYDALGARIVEETGFEAIYISGFAVEASYGKPDMGLLTLTEMVNRAASIAEAVELPIICDANTGYGSAINVIRTVKEFEKAGVSAIHIEDQDLPKRCGSFPHKHVISKEEMIGKIHAAVDSRTDQSFVIIARTDTFETGGIEEIMARGHAYIEAGADMIMPILPLTETQIKTVCTSFPKPVVLAVSEVRIQHSFPKLEKMGVKIAVVPLTLTFSAITAMRRAARDMKKLGSFQSILQQNDSWESVLELVGFNRFASWLEQYSAQAVKKK